MECKEFVVHNEIVDEVSKKLPTEEELFKLVNLLKVFSDSTITRILSALFEHELCVCDISEVLDMSHSSISHQLKILRDMKLVKTKKIGKSVFYSLMDDHILEIIKIGVEHVNE